MLLLAGLVAAVYILSATVAEWRQALREGRTPFEPAVLESIRRE
jgi:hypothetical protein